MRDKNSEKDNSIKKEENKEKSFVLHTNAVDDLINANNENSPEITTKELKEYSKDSISKIPSWIKALFIKFWFNGAVCFFIIWGLGMFFTDKILDLLFVTALVMGVINDLLVNNILRFFDVDGEYVMWTLFPQKKLWTFFANIGYAFVVLALVVITYGGSNMLINGISGLADFTTKIQVEPILFGLLFLVYDLIFVGLKMFLKKLIKDANKKLTVAEVQKIQKLIEENNNTKKSIFDDIINKNGNK